MTNLFDLFNTAQGGQAAANLAGQFGLTPQQTEAVLEAMLPAFAAGLKRLAADPQGWPSLVNLMAKAQQSAVVDSFSTRLTPQALSQGQEMINAVFRSPEVTQAVTRQIEASTGVGQAVLAAMMPAMMAMFAGGLAQAATRQPDLMRAFTEAWKPPTTTVQPNTNGGGLLGALLGSILEQGTSQAKPAAPPADGLAFFNQMLDAGREAQARQIDQMTALIDRFLKKP